ncbi:MAG: hypothetical protein JO223_00150 [Hyphomicrobiales bacterium]|nr:hypothetical protein [Hyphomicrobiales bacterium]MBV8441081.1 hypothetical protein [Hyphomicrobiales bacterium]
MHLGDRTLLDAADLVAGGVAATPIRLPAEESAAEGAPAISATVTEAAAHCADGAKTLPGTAYKIDLLRGLLRDLIEALIR